MGVVVFLRRGPRNEATVFSFTSSAAWSAHNCYYIASSMHSHEMFLIPFRRYIISMTVCMHCVCVYIIMCNHHSALHSTYVYGLWTGGLLVMCMALYSVLRGALFLFSIHLNQQVETSTEEDPDSDSPPPAALPYPNLWRTVVLHLCLYMEGWSMSVQV